VGYDGPTVMLSPLNKPRRLPDGGLDWSGPLHMSDGPIRLDKLLPRILGRVIGILDEARQDPDANHRMPEEAMAVPSAAPEDEIKWRYLAFLTAERDHLARELTAISGSRVFCYEDTAVNRFFSPHSRAQGERG